MKIGLLSMQRVNNYGSFWKAYCLKRILQGVSSDVEFMDILPGDVQTRTEFHKTFSLKKLCRIPYYIFQHRKSTMFAQAQSAALGCASAPNYSADYDAIVIGSDEVFNFVQQSPWGFSTQLFGEIDNDNVNSYAASFGSSTLEAVRAHGYGERIAGALNHMHNISVRDRNSFEIVRALTGIEPELHLDPVLVGDLPLDGAVVNAKRPYILVYSYDFRFADEALIRQIRALARKEHCCVYSVGFYQSWCDRNILPTPTELLTWFRDARWVVTDTFHGSIFSMRNHRPFATVIRDTNQQKLTDLLERTGMSGRIVRDRDSLEGCLREEINYVGFEDLRQHERMRAEMYLKRCLQGTE